GSVVAGLAAWKVPVFSEGRHWPAMRTGSADMVGRGKVGRGAEKSNEIEREMGELARPFFGDEVVVFESYPGPQTASVKARLEGDDIADFEGVVPSGIDARDLVGVEPDPVASVVEKSVAVPALEFAMHGLEHFAARLP